MRTLFALASGFFLLLTGLGMVPTHREGWPVLLGTGAVLLLLAAPLTGFTLLEAQVAAHLTFPVFLLLWPAFLLLCLILGGVQARRERWPLAWPLLGVPVSLLAALALTRPSF